MNQKDLNSFLNNMFRNNVEFAKVHGTSSLMDAKVMLVADALSENIELLGQVIKESFEDTNIYKPNSKNRFSAFI